MIGLSEVQASLSLFAEAIVGQPVPFVTVEDVGECWPWVAAADPHKVCLPVQLESREMYRSMLLHQLLTHDYETSQPGFHQVYALVEDHRVNAEIRRFFPGAANDLERVLKNAREREDMQGAPDALELLRLHTLGASRASVMAFAEEPKLLSIVIGLADEVTVAAATSADSVRLAAKICDLLIGFETGRSRADLLVDLEADDDEPALPTEGTTGVSVDGGTPSEFVESDGLAGGQLLGEMGDQTVGVVEPDDSERPQVGLRLPTIPSADAASANRRTFVYDEWDYHAGQHRRAWCRVIEEHLVGNDHSFIADVRSRHQALRSQIRRHLLRVRPQDLVRVHRSVDGDELDIDAAIEAMADRRSGAPVDDRLQIRRDRAARDVATAFLVDLSASTSSPAVPPEPEPAPVDVDPYDDPMSYGPIWGAAPETELVRRVIDVAKDAVALMGDALHELGDRYAIYGFSGTGRDNVEFKIGKNFADRVTPASWAAVSEMKPLRYTRMGPAVRHAAAKLAAESARTKLLIVISDGYPQDTDYGLDRHDRDYGMHDTARALADATDAGIETFCVTIDPAGHDYLRMMCPDHRYLVIDDVESLPAELAKLYLLELFE